MYLLRVLDIELGAFRNTPRLKTMYKSAFSNLSKSFIYIIVNQFWYAILYLFYFVTALAWVCKWALKFLQNWNLSSVTTIPTQTTPRSNASIGTPPYSNPHYIHSSAFVCVFTHARWGSCAWDLPARSCAARCARALPCRSPSPRRYCRRQRCNHLTLLAIGKQNYVSSNKLQLTFET